MRAMQEIFFFLHGADFSCYNLKIFLLAGNVRGGDFSIVFQWYMGKSKTILILYVGVCKKRFLYKQSFFSSVLKLHCKYKGNKEIQ